MSVMYMRQSILLLLYSLMLFSFGCAHDKDIYQTFQEAEKYIESDPQKSSKILDSQNIDYYDMPEHWQAQYVLLKCSIAKNMEADYPLVDQIIAAKSWFSKQKEIQKEIQLGLFLAISLFEDKNIDGAHLEYISNLDKAIENKLFNEAGYLNSHLGDLYTTTNDLQSALKKYKEGKSYFKSVENKRSEGYALRDIARTYCLLDSISTAYYLMRKADSLSIEIDDIKLRSSIYNGFGNIALAENKLDTAIMYLKKGIEIDTVASISNYLAISDIYIQKSDYLKSIAILDSINQLVLSENYKRGLYLNYYMAYSEQGNFQEALHHLEEFVELFQQNLSDETDQNFIEIEKKYNHFKMVSQIQSLTINNQKYIIISITALALLLMLIIYYLYIRMRNRKLFYLKESELKKTQIEILKLTRELENKNKELLSSDSVSLKQKAKEISALKEKLNIIRNNQLNYSLLKKELQAKIETTKVYNKPLITEMFWSRMQEEAEIIFPGFSNHLSFNFPNLTHQEIRYCCLSIYNFDTKQEAILIGINPDSIKKRRTRIREKIDISLINSNLHSFLMEYFTSKL